MPAVSIIALTPNQWILMAQQQQLDPPHEFYMQQALREAQAAGDEDEVPIGAVVVYRDPRGVTPG